MSDLSRSLVDAAAEVIANRNRRAWKHSDDVQYRLEASDVLTVALRLLADDVAAQPIELVDLTAEGQLYNSGKHYMIGLLRRLADEIREARDE